MSALCFEQKQMATNALGCSMLEINLTNIVKNFKTLQSLCPSADVYPVLKANAYGLGAIPIGAALERAGAKSFFIAYIGEALALRQHLTEVDLYLLNGPYTTGWEKVCFEYNVIPVLNTYETIKDWHAFAKSQGLPLRAALHIDTGMRRLGLSAQELKHFLAVDFPYINWVLVMSHLACADDFSHEMNEKQRLNFEALHKYFPTTKFSLANSPGIFLGQAYHYDVVRPGGSLYGHKPTGEGSPIISCITMKSQVLQIQHLEPGESVGYGCTFIAEKPTIIATLGLGYADGLLRHLSGKDAYALVNGQKAPFVGRVSMDLVTINITSIKDVAVGNWAVLMGGDEGAMMLDDVARKVQTDSRDVLVGLGDRFNRIHTI
ncbi:MAG: alanine racemase [Candidatus Paracaedibacteraceae bacterium]|nr:alanine racemase [Candidatus Paracaedibacteraceae bacterium]